MSTVMWTLSLLLWIPGQGAGDPSSAQGILGRYLAIPHPQGPSKTDPYDPKMDALVNNSRRDREAVLAGLKAMPAEAVPAAEAVLFSEQASPQQRYEIVGMLAASIHTRPCADLLHRVISTPREPADENSALYEELTRCSAVQGLRMMSRRTDRTGGQRIERRSGLEPEVPGLVPYLISAADDKAERVRQSALYGLADSRDPSAVLELRRRLSDTSEEVRLYAACFLTEYQDASGLAEMRKALDRLRKADPAKDFRFYTDVEMLVASMERITGKRFGPLPLNPLLSSVTTQAEAGRRRYQALLATWGQWWEWEPADLTP